MPKRVGSAAHDDDQPQQPRSVQEINAAKSALKKRRQEGFEPDTVAYSQKLGAIEEELERAEMQEAEPEMHESVNAADAMLGKFSKTLKYDAQAEAELKRRDHRMYGNDSLFIVPLQYMSDEMRDFVYTKLIRPENKADLLRFHDQGGVHEAISVRKVSHAHPSHKLKNRYTSPEEQESSYCLFANKNIAKNTFLGYLSGLMTSGSEFDQFHTHNQRDLLSEINGFELKGCLQSRGGWMDDTDTDNNANVLVCDFWRHQNEFCFLSDFRKDPASDPKEAIGLTGRIPNVTIVEMVVRGIPRLAFISSAFGSELITDFGEEHWRAFGLVVKRADDFHSIRIQYDDALKRASDLEQLYEPVRQDRGEFKQNNVEARKAATSAELLYRTTIEEHEEYKKEKSYKQNSSILPIKRLGELDFNMFDKVFRARRGKNKAHPNEVVKLLSTLENSYLRNDSFIPKKVVVVSAPHFVNRLKLISANRLARDHRENGVAKSVPNDKCKITKKLFKSYSKVIAQIVIDAWEELDKYGSQLDAFSRANGIPWDYKNGKPMDSKDVIQLLSAQLIELRQKLSPEDEQPSEGEEEEEEDGDSKEQQKEDDMEQEPQEVDGGDPQVPESDRLKNKVTAYRQEWKRICRRPDPRPVWQPPPAGGGCGSGRK